MLISPAAPKPSSTTRRRLPPRGIFISFEGIDGAGKTTQLRSLVRRLRRQGYAVCATREPGGTPLGETLRRLLVAGAADLAPLAELALVYAARAQHLERVIRPALARGEIVVSDRYNHSSLAFQGYGRRLGEAPVRKIDGVICGSIQPDLTLVLDIDPRVALGRARDRENRRRLREGRFEAEGIEFQRRVRAGYRALAKKEPKRMRLVPADRPPGEVEAEIRRVVDKRLRLWRPEGARRQE